MTFTSAEFTMDMFEMANDLTGDDEAYKYEDAKKASVDASHKIMLPKGVAAEDIYVDGFEQAASASAGKYKVTTGSDTETELLFHTDVEEGTELIVFYAVSVSNSRNLNVTTDQAAARGEVIFTWPILSAADDSAQSSVKGKLQLRIPLARVTAMPGFDTSYKTAATNAVTFTAMDAGRADKKWYSLHFIEN